MKRARAARTMAGMLAAVALCAVVTAARADAGVRRVRLKLQAGGLPFRPRMAMRSPSPTRVTNANPNANANANVNATAGAATSAAADGDAATSLAVQRETSLRRSRRPDEAATMRAQLVTGFGLDGASPAGDPRTLAGQPIADGARDLDGFARARAYGFGALYLGGRNLLVPGLGGYLAGQGQVLPDIPGYPPVASVRDQVGDLRVTSAWAEADEVLRLPLLRSLTLRAGRQYVYGPFIAHLDGARVRWRHRWLEASAYLGSRVADWGGRADAPRSFSPQRGLMAGAELALDLRRTRVPVLVRLRALTFEQRGHADLTIDTRLRRGLDLTAIARAFEGAISHEQVTLRYRLSDRTRLVIDAGYRHRREPIWDLAYRDPEDLRDPIDPRDRYLNLGPRLPRASLRVRAGTVLLDNVDLLLGGAAGLDTSAGDDPADLSPYAASWLEGGGALEVRVRRTFALGVSGLARAYGRDDRARPIVDGEDVTGPLILDAKHLGEKSLVEGGLSARFSGGARTFSVTAEIYARRTSYAVLYVNDPAAGAEDREATGAIGSFDVRGGSRVTLDAWITERVRVRCEYDVSSALETAPEVRDLKSLRILAEGTL